jgi:ABC-2 type transport system permease protein
MSPATYIAAVLFLVLMGWLYWRILLQFSIEPQDALPSELFFQLFWLPVFFMVPLLTMKSVAEERRRGTLETLMTTPANAMEIVLSKFAGAYIFYCCLWLLTLGFPILANLSVNSPIMAGRLLDRGTLSGGYLFVAISGLLFISVGIFASSLTRSQVVAGMLSFCILFIITIGMRELHEEATFWVPWFRDTIEYMQIFRHLEEFSRGVIDTRPFFFYFSNTALVVGISVLVVESKA